MTEAIEFDAHDFFRSDRFVNDPYSYFYHLRDQAPVVREPHQHRRVRGRRLERVPQQHARRPEDRS